ncbi:hypothetical protein [Ferrovibrio terrae]|uniref:hypothetical protein n=1 Tax=Ferrovibrio terrae TaxID=2594003 RepID=UPI0031379098
MKVTARTRSILAARREQRAMRRAGYFSIEADWEMHRGAKSNHVILDVQISADRRHLWVRTGTEARTKKAPDLDASKS